VAGEHAELALGAGYDDHVDVLRTKQLFGGDEFEVEVCHLSLFKV
jgi:hypothetical protein